MQKPNTLGNSSEDCRVYNRLVALKVGTKALRYFYGSSTNYSILSKRKAVENKPNFCAMHSVISETFLAQNKTA